MTPTTQAILNSVAVSDPNLSAGERALLQRLAAGQTVEPTTATPSGAPLLLTQKQAAQMLGISRVSLWRLTREAVFRPVEIFPGRFRYRREEIEAVAREGHAATLRRTTRRGSRS